jgi:hypothetical protein
VRPCGGGSPECVADLFHRHAEFLEGRNGWSLSIAQQGQQHVTRRGLRQSFGLRSGSSGFESPSGSGAKGHLTFLGGASLPPRHATFDALPDRGGIEVESLENRTDVPVAAPQQGKEEVLTPDIVVAEARRVGAGGGDEVAQRGLASSISMIGMPSSTAYTRRQARQIRASGSGR